MGDPKGFLNKVRSEAPYRQACERIKDYKDVSVPRPYPESREQASRCMDCGTPFCNWACPIGNYIPEWNDYAFKGSWLEAFKLLNATNDLPEITGRVCPALCEYSCVLGINDEAVTIRENELAIIEYAFEKNLIKPDPPLKRTGKMVAVVGSGPAGLACASQLNKAGHNVIVFERDEKIGGIMRFGIPDFKLEKKIIERRVDLLTKEGVSFKTRVDVGKGYPTAKLLKEFDAVCLACGSRVPRDLKAEGRQLEGIYFAMDYLAQSNRTVSGGSIDKAKIIDAKGKKVVVVGGGDTGSDCVGTAHRQGASCVVQIEIMPQPPECRAQDQPWPKYPLLLKTSSSHKEGGQRLWAMLTKKFAGKDGKVKALECVKVEFKKAGVDPCLQMHEIPGSDLIIEADLVILALGFLHPEHDGIVSDLGLALDERGNIKTGKDYMTSAKKVFAAGDMRRGQSLVVWAMSEGRKSARAIDEFLMGESSLPSI